MFRDVYHEIEVPSWSIRFTFKNWFDSEVGEKNLEFWANKYNEVPFSINMLIGWPMLLLAHALCTKLHEHGHGQS
jgi:hypothetical protein